MENKEEDGVILFNTFHPCPVWWKRPYWWLRQWIAGRTMRHYIVEEEICINENEEEDNAGLYRDISGRM